MLTITTNSFENDVLHADKPVLVDFWAQWCPYCRRIAPAFDKVGEQYADTLTAGKINYDEEPQLIERFGIDTIPTLMLFKNGEVIGSVVAPRIQGGHRGVYQGNAGAVRAWLWSRSMIRFHVVHFVSP